MKGNKPVHVIAGALFLYMGATTLFGHLTQFQGLPLNLLLRQLLPGLLTCVPNLMIGFAFFKKPVGRLMFAAILLKAVGIIPTDILQKSLSLSTVVSPLCWVLMLLQLQTARKKGKGFRWMVIPVILLYMLGEYFYLMSLVRGGYPFGTGPVMWNLVLGTVAIAMACLAFCVPKEEAAAPEKAAQQQSVREASYSQMLADGIITQEEFDAWKRTNSK